MSDPAPVLDAEPAIAEEQAGAARDRDLLGRKSAPIRKKLDELYLTIKKGWEDQADRSDSQMDWWDCYNCKLNSNQFYNGNAAIYVPIVRDAVNARATRFVNQMFPNSGRYVEVVSEDGKQPSEIIALLDHYIRRRKLKTKVAKPLSINGDIEGQYNLYVDWNEVRRWIVSRETHAPQIDGVDDPDAEPIEDITAEEEIVEGSPAFEVLHDSDVLVLPATADSVEEALERGGLVAIVRRWSKADIEQKIESGEIREDEGDELLKVMRATADGRVTDQEKALAEAVGIRAKGTHCTVWEVWHKLPLSDKGYDKESAPRLCRLWFGPEAAQLGAKRNPYWNDLCPLISEPVAKVAGVFKGASPIEPVAPLQYEANDAANEGADSAHYSAMPLVRVSPEVTQPIILNLGAILKAGPGEIEMIAFPDLGDRAIKRIATCTTAIFQTLGISPAMLPHQTGRPGAKRNQAEIALEQQVDLLTTAEAVTVLEEGIFTPAMGWIVDLDHQFRDRELTTRMFGILGKRAEMMPIPVLHNRARYTFKWLGAEAARNAAMQQQQISFINVVRGLRQELAAEGYRLRIGPILENAAMSVFGAATGSHVIEDMRHQSSLDPQMENELLAGGHEVPVLPLDEDIQHIKAHMQGAQAGDPLGNFKLHIQAHMQQMKLKMAAQAQQAMQQMMAQQGGAGSSSAGGARGGAPGAPRQGASPAGPRLVAQKPAGAIHPDQMARAGAATMPRKT